MFNKEGPFKFSELPKYYFYIILDKYFLIMYTCLKS